MKKSLSFFLAIFLVSNPYAQTACTFSETTCTQGAETRNIDGVQVYKTCWKYTDSFNCVDNNISDYSDCQDLLAQGCTDTGKSVCFSEFDSSCNTRQREFSCAKSTNAISQCMDITTTCDNGKCFETSAPPDNDLANVIAQHESARQIGVYNNQNNIFSGQGDSCKVKFGKSCCKVIGGAQPNSNILNKQGADKVAMASKYAYDFLYPNASPIGGGKSSVMMSLLGTGATYAKALATGTATTINSYGMTISISGNGSAAITGFDPYTLAATIAIQAIIKYLQCSNDEQLLGLKRGANLCTFSGSHCSKKLLKTCIETTQAYCCYNSLLAKIINSQGRQQLGLGASCSGLSIEQIQKIDMSKIDFTEFVNSAMAQLPNTAEKNSIAQEAAKKTLERLKSQGKN
jgi:conjugal transfer mating pair stabilization protein TraN